MIVLNQLDERIENLEDAKFVFEKLDEFNHIIPELLTIKRKEMEL